ncbi:HD domain-containing protein [Deinococcus sp. SDU3-2]|uniref:HD domain-containing protein n=1 Tax=Deinococcus terrestris TaxID=2651870 RepID=A0A7X1NUI2_9DEIO|nr:HD domain-containing protein [Deinococcus terrestris]
MLARLLARPSAASVLDGALAHAAALLGSEAKGYAVLGRGAAPVVAVHGYPRTLAGTTLEGPWVTAGGRPQLLQGRDLYAANPPEALARLEAAGARQAPLTFVVPLTDHGRTLGALVLDCPAGTSLSPAAQSAVTAWAASVAPLVAVMESRREWRQTARQIASAVVEAVESLEFDALGHGEAVADLAVRLGEAAGLSPREREELWYAALLHDLGKIHGEPGHAQMGANFLHSVSHFAEAQRAIRHHHERWDGQGEPDGLSGEEIPLYARLLAVANASAHADGNLAAVQAQAGTVLDPQLVELLASLPPAPAGAEA